jgi:hypothetical protein
MKTKQEIIDYIIENLAYYNDHTNPEFYPVEKDDKLIQMIEDLKPVVKKLPWKYNEIKLPGTTLDQYITNEYVITHFTDEDDSWMATYKPYDENVDLEIPRDGYIGCMRGTLKQAQEACQKHYEESILGAIEY